jgi:hypothetical protein
MFVVRLPSDALESASIDLSLTYYFLIIVFFEVVDPS